MGNLKSMLNIALDEMGVWKWELTKANKRIVELEKENRALAALNDELLTQIKMSKY